MNTYADDPRRQIVDADAERAVLGSILIDPDAIARIANTVQSADFFGSAHRSIYAAMLRMHDQQIAIDMITLSDTLEESEALDDIGGPAYISGLINSTPTSMHIDHYAKIVADLAVRRRLMGAGGKLAEIAYDDSLTTNEALGKAEQVVFGVAQSRSLSAVTDIRTATLDVLDSIDVLLRDGVQPGIQSGFSMLDRLTGGFQPGELVIIAARPGMGKTSIAVNMAENAANLLQARSLIFSLEMSKAQLIKRIIISRTGIDSYKLRTGQINQDEYDAIIQATSQITQLPILIDDTPAMSIDDMRREARRVHAEHGLDMIIVDYIQIASGTGQIREQEISYITRGLKQMARELNVPVVALSQLNRGVESRADKRPTLGDLRESGAIEQEADSVLFIYREDYYNEHTERQNIADVIIAKNRHGSTGTASLYFDKERTKFSDLELQRHEFHTNGTGPKRQAVTA